MADEGPSDTAPIEQNESQSNQQPPAPPPLTDEKIVENWFQRDAYLEIETTEDNENARRTYSVTMDQFLNITTMNGDHSWLKEDVIMISLALLTQKSRRSDCLLVPTFDSQQLCDLGLGNITIEDADPVSSPISLRKALEDEEKRWIIMPCNDGFLENTFNIPESEKERVAGQQNASTEKETGTEAAEKETNADATVEETSADATEKGNSADAADKETGAEATGKETGTKGNKQKEKEKEAAPQKEHGSHWGLLIIDKQKETARWIDGLIDLDRRGRIVSMLTAGRAAGKVLCGYDTLLGRKKGAFATSTLKYVPHQRRDNASREDAGACGPYMYAFLNYVYSEGTQYLEDLRHEFRKDRIGHHRRSMGFNSKFDSGVARERMSRIIQDERRSQEGDQDLPFRLTPRLFRILNVPISRAMLLRLVLAYLREARRGLPGPGGNDNDDDSNDDNNDNNNNDNNSKNNDNSTEEEKDFQDWCSKTSAQLTDEVLKDLMKDNPALYTGMNFSQAKRLCLGQIYERLNPKMPQDNNGDQDKSGSQDNRNRIGLEELAHLDMKNIDPGRREYLIQMRAAIARSKGPKDPKDSVNFTHKTEEQIKLWVEKDRALGVKLHNDQELWYKKTVLQQMFGRIKDLSKEDIGHWRAQDPYFENHREDGYEDAIARLENRIADVDTPDLRGRILYYGEWTPPAGTKRKRPGGAPDEQSSPKRSRPSGTAD